LKKLVKPILIYIGEEIGVMTSKLYQVLEEFNPKIHNVSLTKQQSKCIKYFKKGEQFKPKIFLESLPNDFGTSNCNDQKNATRYALTSTLKIAKGLGIVVEVSTNPIEFKDFLELESIQYFSDQLRGSKNKNIKDNQILKSTKKDYLYRVWEFNNWLHGMEFEFKQTKHLSETTFEIVTEKITLDGIEHFLNLYKKSFNSDSDFIRVIKKFLNHQDNKKCSAGYMKLKYASIMAYFEKNECELKFKYDSNVNHNDYSNENADATLSLEDLLNMLTTGRASILDKAVVLCKFQRGLDNTTLVDRFNFQAWHQLVEYFGTEQYQNWDLSKCPVPIRLTRIKTNYTHTGYLDVDAIQAVQKYLNVRYEKTGSTMKDGEPLFLGRTNQPIKDWFVAKLIPKLARNAGIQKSMNSSELVNRNEKTSHELRDLLKSTLIVEGVAPYVCELAIGHKVGDSYEKQDKLYPDKSREEYMKASSKINIFSNIVHNMNGSADATKYKKQIEDNQKVMTELVKDNQNSMDSKGELYQMIAELRAEVTELKKERK